MQNETANRLAFLYRVKSREEKDKRRSTEEISVLLLRNILPDHVAQHYIENGQQGAVSGRGGAGRDGAVWVGQDQLVVSGWSKTSW